ncbi:hypothetical protein CDAR_557661 [Caerostris darwini]|uniref:Uncharacterized protein n=1 Tax=Caerostris darwini TaxID=1538125 RepID=A0AAV4VCQ8_9ARAC|nr:hypothetical protein CDAR_557661 [Caerostris darwini]
MRKVMFSGLLVIEAEHLSPLNDDGKNVCPYPLHPLHYLRMATLSAKSPPADQPLLLSSGDRSVDAESNVSGLLVIEAEHLSPLNDNGKNVCPYPLHYLRMATLSAKSPPADQPLLLSSMGSMVSACDLLAGQLRPFDLGGGGLLGINKQPPPMNLSGS